MTTLREAIGAALAKGRKTLPELAKLLDTSEDSVRGRIAELRKQGVDVHSAREGGQTVYCLAEANEGSTPSDFADLVRFLKNKFKTSDEIAEKFGSASIVTQARGTGIRIGEYPVGTVRFYGIFSPPKQADVKEVIVDDTPENGVYKFGIVSDTHLGSKHALLGQLNRAYDVFRGAGINIVLHAGDLVDGSGKIFPGQMQELSCLPTPECMADEVINRYPKRQGMQTFWISGNHDCSWKREGIDFPAYLNLRLADAGRKDMTYLGEQYGVFRIGDDFRIDLCHPSGMGGASLSNYVKRLYNKKNTPDMLLMGHWHKYAEEITGGVHGIMLPCLQGFRSYLTTAAFHDNPGFMTLEVVVKRGQIVRKVVELFPIEGGPPK
jgi:predicted phosphodiesterase/biotin operon repressor